MFFLKKKDKQNSRRPMPKWVPKWLQTPLRFLFRCMLAGLLALLIVVGFYAYQASQYNMSKVGEMPPRTVVLDKYGNEYATLYGDDRRLATYEEIPAHLLEALYAREDEDFEQHNGVKLKGLIRATIRNIRDGQYTQGGSTLSMQLVKNTFNNREKSIHRKLLEIALTLRLESNYSKSEIVTHYLNRIYFGASCYGIEEASLRYFGKTVSDLHPGESAMLIGIIRGPAIFNPVKSLDQALEQRDQVIKRRVTVGQITQAEADQILQLPIHIKKKSQTRSSKSYTLQAIERHLKVVLKMENVDKNALRIKTTIDPDLIQKVDTLHQHLPEELQTASVIIDSKTGAILAVNGGRDVQKFPWNIALDSSKRQLEKAFEPIIYLSALEANRNPIKNHPIETARQIDPQELIRFAKSLGLKGSFPQNEDLYHGLTNASALTLATAYTAIGNHGKVCHTFIIDEIHNTNEELIYQHPSKSEQVASKGNVNELLKLYNVNNSQNFRLVSVNEDRRDAWAILTGANTTQVIWVGRLDGKPMQIPAKTLRKSLEAMLK